MIRCSTKWRSNASYKSGAKSAGVRRLANRFGRIDRLIRVAEADHYGRATEYSSFEAGEWLIRNASELDVEKSGPKPIILGRNLIDMGMKPGPEFSEILERCFNAQLDGTITDIDSGLIFVKKHLA